MTSTGMTATDKTSIVITGANGFIGSLLASRLTIGAAVAIGGTSRTISKRTLIDQYIPDDGANSGEWIKGDIGDHQHIGNFLFDRSGRSLRKTVGAKCFRCTQAFLLLRGNRKQCNGENAELSQLCHFVQ